MLVCSFRLAVVTLDGEGNVIGRKAVSPYRGYDYYDQAEEAARMVPVGANQRVEIERFIDSSRYEAGWAKGLIF